VVGSHFFFRKKSGKHFVGYETAAAGKAEQCALLFEQECGGLLDRVIPGRGQSRS
jgi:hypothetical protein